MLHANLAVRVIRDVGSRRQARGRPRVSAAAMPNGFPRARTALPGECQASMEQVSWGTLSSPHLLAILKAWVGLEFAVGWQ